MADMTTQKIATSVWLAVGAALLLWASAFPGIRAGLAPVGGIPGPDGFGPGELALLRFGTASIVLVIYALVVRLRMPHKEDLGRIAAAGVLGISIYHLALNFGERTVESGAAALLISLSPVITALLSTHMLGEKLSRWGWTGIAISFAGGMLVSAGAGGEVGLEPGAFLILIATISTSLYFLVSKPGLMKYTATEFTSYAIWAGTIPLLFFAPTLLGQIEQAPTAAISAGVYLGVFPGAIAYVFWGYGLSKMPASRVSAFLYLQPANAAIIAYFWLNEVPAVAAIVGGIVSIAGVVILNTLGQRPPHNDAIELAEESAHG